MIITQVAELFSVDCKEEQVPMSVGLLLQKFGDVFEEPKGLPPERGLEHSIPLKPGSLPVYSRPYKYPHFQKDEIESQVCEMLKSSIIRPSQSPFASPTLLVKKKDDTWRF